MSFKSTDEMEAYLAPLHGSSKDDLVTAESRNSFTSLRSYLDPNEDTEETALAAGKSGAPASNDEQAVEKDGVTREDFPVSDAFLSTLNSRGEVQIGESVYKVTRDNVYSVSPADVAILNEKVPTLSSPAPTDGDDRIKIYQVETTLPREFGEQAAVADRAVAVDGPQFHHIPGVSGNCYVTAGDYRMHGKSYRTNLFFYAEAGVTTEWERRRRIWWVTIWSNTWQSGTLSHSYTSALLFGLYGGPAVPIGPASGSQSQTGTARIHETLAWGVGTGVRITGNIHAEHRVNNSTINGSCRTAI
ncbi:MAG TPA: hypothetical protein VE913_09095 [Longimicrobium sp.]|nr:hypothetical protein [Longimicrobium sp.]